MSNVNRYQGYSEQQADQDSAEAAALSGSVYMDLVEGDNVVRFLPMEIGDKSIYRKTSMHYVEGVPGLEKRVAFACPRVELKQPCLCCHRAKELGKSGNAADRSFAKDISGGLRIYSNVLNRIAPEAGPMVLGFGKQILEGLKALRKSKRLGGDFTDPGPGGFDVIIRRVGTGMATSYTVHADRGNSPLAATQEEIDAICDQRHDLNACVNTEIPAALQVAWGGSVQPIGTVTRAAAQLVSAVPAAAQPVGTIGSHLVGGGQQSPGAADSEVEYDDDFNPIVR